MFAEGLDRNMTVESLKLDIIVTAETMDALADGLERMMRNRADAATRGGHDQEEPLPVLKELELRCIDAGTRKYSRTVAGREQFFDRLSRSDVLRVERVKFDLSQSGPLKSSKVYDFIRSTRVTKSLVLGTFRQPPRKKKFADFADALEANNSISELELGCSWSYTMSDLLFSPNKYRIRCQCRRNEVQVQTLRKGENLSLLPLVLAGLLSWDDTPTGYVEEDCEIEARQLVDRTVAYEILKEHPVLFAVSGKRKRED